MSEFNIKTLVRKVDLLTLRLFLSIVEEGHIARAATRENIAASAVTRRIQDFEGVIGHKLFYRETSGIVLTPVGEVVARHLRGLYETLHHMRNDLSEFAEGVRGQVRIWANEASIIQYLASDLSAFLRDFPLVEIELKEEFSPNMLRAVLSGAADVGVFAPSGASLEGLDVVEYRPDQLFVILRKDHPLAQRPSLYLSELYDYDMISLRPETSVMVRVHQAAQEAGRELKMKYQVATTLSACSLVRAGLGIVVQPDGMIGARDIDMIASVPLADHWARRTLSIAMQNRKELPSAARLLVKHLTQRPEPIAAGCDGAAADR